MVLVNKLCYKLLTKPLQLHFLHGVSFHYMHFHYRDNLYSRPPTSWLITLLECPNPCIHFGVYPKSYHDSLPRMGGPKCILAKFWLNGSVTLMAHPEPCAPCRLRCTVPHLHNVHYNIHIRFLHRLHSNPSTVPSRKDK